MHKKRGWLRIMEAVIAILILSSIMLLLYINNVPQKSVSSSIGDLQSRVLDEMSSRADLRDAVLLNNSEDLLAFVSPKIPSNFNYTLIVCDLSSPCQFSPSTTKEVYVEDRIVSANLGTYSPKVVRLFVWEK